MPIPLKISVEGRFLKQLRERTEKWRGAKIGAMITVPPELAWWYWNEFGTASKSELGGSSYTIAAVTAKELAFPQGGEMTYRHSVQHPGVKPSRSVTKVLPEIRRDLADSVHQAFQNGAADNPSELYVAILDATEEARQQIGDSISQNITGLRDIEPEKGRLGGRTASEVFNSESKVSDLSEG